MNYSKFAWLVTAIISTKLLLVPAKEAIPPGPEFRIEETLVSYRNTGTNDYLAFPAIAPLNSNEIMLSYKRGR